MKEFTAVILAAGKGVRMKSPVPKVLNRLGGKPLIYYVLKEVSSLKCVKQIIVVVGYKGGDVKRYVSKHFKGAEFAAQRNQLGTAHAVAAAAKKIKYPNTIILCGDAPLITRKTLLSFIDGHRAKSSHLTLMSAYMENRHNMGVVLRDGLGEPKEICEVINLKARSPMEEVNSGVYAVGSRVLKDNLARIKKDPVKGEYFLTDIVGLCYSQSKKVTAVNVDTDEILGINSPAELCFAYGVLRKRIIHGHLDNGVKIVDPNTTFIEEGVRIGKNSVIYPFTFIEKHVTIGSNCFLGPFIRLREGARVGDNVRLGNFVEINRCDLDSGVTMKHFGYLGDTAVGRDANIGAGTVVANYDGRNKNKTVIGQESFIGCDAILVAPVNIGKKSLVGAGSVVTKDVPDKTVVVGVPARKLKSSGRKGKSSG